jgi:hypothetical protein
VLCGKGTSVFVGVPSVWLIFCRDDDRSEVTEDAGDAKDLTNAAVGIMFKDDSNDCVATWLTASSGLWS